MIDSTFKYLRLARVLGSQDLKQAYRRSALGPFWLTAGMAVQISTIGVVFGFIFKSELRDYLPFLAVGIIGWGLISETISEACMSLIESERMIKQLPIPIFIYSLKVVWKNILSFGHNLVIVPVLFVVIGKPVTLAILLFIPGLIVVVICISWVAILLGVISARFRDFPPIVRSLMAVGFYVTPVMWQPGLLPQGPAHFLLGLNPLYHLLQLIRLPWLGELPTVENWVAGICTAIVGSFSTLLILNKLGHRVAYWV
jgi:ABC-type polysaccharide/polyol phosphate export permease